MSGVLKHTLIVRHPETDAPTGLIAGTEVPDWASKLVHADDLEGGETKAPAKRAASSKTKSED